MMSGPIFHILTFLAVGTVFILLALLASRLISPKKPNPEKNAAYESGEQAVGNTWPSISSGYYVIAILFLLFEVEIVLLFPLAVVSGNNPGDPSAEIVLIELIGFVAVLAAGLAYAWGHGHLDWMSPKPPTDDLPSPVPPSQYEEFNKRYS